MQITGGAGFVGSHLTDKLMMDGHEVTVVDNFFTGRKRNVEHWIGHENFELINHDVVEPLYIEGESPPERTQAGLLHAWTLFLSSRKWPPLYGWQILPFSLSPHASGSMESTTALTGIGQLRGPWAISQCCTPQSLPVSTRASASATELPSPLLSPWASCSPPPHLTLNLMGHCEEFPH